jgi:hypothetical protein
MRPIIRTALTIVLALATPAPALAEETKPAPLPALGADISQTSVSGISSGAYMAGQFEIAHSKLVIGAAIIAGGPYGCADSAYSGMMPGPGAAFLNLSQAMNGCMLNAMRFWGVPNPKQLADKTKRLAEEDRIDPIADVRKDRIYLFSGSNDHTVVPAIVAAAAEYYADLGLDPANIKQVTRVSAGHAFVTDDSGLACDRSSSPYVVDCDYDQAGDLLAHIYREFNARVATPSGKFIDFDQQPFFTDEPLNGLADTGVVYVPPRCATGPKCRIHIAFHGCAQNRAAAGDAFIRETGFARWADSNDLVILFPQVAASPLNPQGCWDWWGYTGSDYLTKEAPQIKAVYRMLERLGAPQP